MAVTNLTHPQAERDGVEAWAAAWRRALPVLALIGPGSWFAAALIRAAGIDTLDGELDWISAPEGLVMSLGAPFFAATFIVLGLTIARRAVRTGIAITALGLVGTGALTGIAWFRVFMAKFTDEGLNPDAMNQAFEASHVWDIAAITMIGNFAAWLVAGIVILKTAVVPRWVGACCIGGAIAVILGQAAYVALEVFWPLGTGLWLLATNGVVRAHHRSS
ncbi:MAG: hypothetical protein ACR2OH_05565 [Microthrixaceae bacterium]